MEAFICKICGKVCFYPVNPVFDKEEPVGCPVCGTVYLPEEIEDGEVIWNFAD